MSVKIKIARIVVLIKVSRIVDSLFSKFSLYTAVLLLCILITVLMAVAPFIPDIP